MSARDAIDRLNRSRSQIRGELPDRAPLDYLERMFDDVEFEAEELPPLGARPLWDFQAKFLIVLLMAALVVGVIGCWPRLD
ncbi:hypothetical protein NKH82_17665 [Mesorhizobium sp. M0915]|uniref:hypothetical protein n=1 Tax=Mesorhizobium sp. M0915 TaxID=2957027 RepID=UPI00333A5F1F